MLHSHITTKNILFFVFIVTFLLSCAMINNKNATSQSSSKISFYQNGKETILEESENDAGVKNGTNDALNTLANAVDFFDSFFMEENLRKMKQEKQCLEIIFPGPQTLHLVNLNREIEFDRILFIYRNRNLQYMFWGLGSYRLKGYVLGGQDKDGRLLEQFEKLAAISD